MEPTDLPDVSSMELAILGAVRSIRYGSVEIVIHDSKVVQIERKEKVRFETGRNGLDKKKT